MGWRDALKIEPLPQKPQYPQKGSDAGSFVPFVAIVPGGEDLKTEPVPQDAGDFEQDVDAAVAELNQLWADAGTEMGDIPIATRRRALHLESEMTQRANSGDLAGARAALREWKGCWVPTGLNVQQGQD